MQTNGETKVVNENEYPKGNAKNAYCNQNRCFCSWGCCCCCCCCYCQCCTNPDKENSRKQQNPAIAPKKFFGSGGSTEPGSTEPEKRFKMFLGAIAPKKFFGRDGSTEPDERRTRRTTNQTNDEPDERTNEKKEPSIPKRYYFCSLAAFTFAHLLWLDLLWIR